MTIRCPVCQKVVGTSGAEKTESMRFSPFCSERCKLIDLGAWLSAEYKIVSLEPSKESADLPDAPSAFESE